MGWARVAAFQPRGPGHRAEREKIWRAAQKADAAILLHLSAGSRGPGEIEHYTLVRCYQALQRHLPPGMTLLSLFNLATRTVSLRREALWHGVIRRNYGCSHLILEEEVLREGMSAEGISALAGEIKGELGVEMIAAEEMAYAPSLGKHLPVGDLPQSEAPPRFGDAELQHSLTRGHEIPNWFSFPEVVAELRKAFPPANRQGLTLFFTGLSGAGKSTLARVVSAKLKERGERSVTLLDGDIVRHMLSSELGFSREHRDLNILRIGFVASEVTRHGGLAICAAIAPYRDVRRKVRRLVSAHGNFVEVFLSTPLETCEARDRKGMYAKARAGLVSHFTGISDPYEEPESAEIVINTSDISPEEAAERIFLFLREKNLMT